MRTHILKITGLVTALSALLLGALGVSMHTAATATESAPKLAEAADQCKAETAGAKEKKSFFVSCGGFF